MKVKLKVLHGKNAGRELQISGPHFLIGRSEECHLRAKSDMISRRHCAIILTDTQVSIRDLKSKNGCLVNGEKVETEQVLKMGDQLRIGPLEFEVLIDHTLGASKKPKVQDIQEAASRTAGNSSTGTDEVDISSWLMEHDAIERERRASEPDTRQFKLPEISADAVDETSEVPSEEIAQEKKRRIPDKNQKPGKLPKIEKESAKDTRSAAEDTLNKMFKR